MTAAVANTESLPTPMFAAAAPAQPSAENLPTPVFAAATPAETPASSAATPSEMEDTPEPMPSPPEPMPTPSPDEDVVLDGVDGSAARAARKQRFEAQEKARLERVADAIARKREKEEQRLRLEERKNAREEIRMQRVAAKVEERRAFKGLTEEEIRQKKLADKVAAQREARKAEEEQKEKQKEEKRLQRLKEAEEKRVQKEKEQREQEEKENQAMSLPSLLRPDGTIDPELLQKAARETAERKRKAAALAEANGRKRGRLVEDDNEEELKVEKVIAPAVDDFVSDRRARVAQKAAARRAAMAARLAKAKKMKSADEKIKSAEKILSCSNGEDFLRQQKEQEATSLKKAKPGQSSEADADAKKADADAKKPKAKAKKGAKKKGGAKKGGVKKKGKAAKGKAKANKGKGKKVKKKGTSSSSSSDSSNVSEPSPGAMAIARALALGEAVPTKEELEKIEQSKNKGPSFTWEREIKVPEGTSVILSPQLGGVCVGVTNSQVWTSGVGSQMGPRASPQEVEYFIVANSLGAECAKRVRGLPPSMQKEVIDQGPIDSARSADGVVFTRIKTLEEASKATPLGTGATFASAFAGNPRDPGRPGANINPEIEDIIRKARLDPQAANLLRRLPADRQAEARNLPLQHATAMGQSASQVVINHFGQSARQEVEIDRFSRDPTRDAVMRQFG